MTLDPTNPTEPTPEATPPAAEPEGQAQATAANPEQATQQPATPPTPTTPVAGSLFQDRPLTPVEAKRRDVARMQPTPWRPTDADLDPSSDTGWEVAADHELIAIRPEDVPVPDYQLVADPLTGLTPAAAAATPAAAAAVPTPAAPTAVPTTAALSWAKAASMPAASAGVPVEPALLPPLALAPAAAAAAIPAATGATEVVGAPTGTRWGRRPVEAARTGFKATVRPMMLIGLFVVGVALGWTAFLRQQPVAQPAAPPPAAADNGTSTTVPPQIASLVAALSEDNQTAVQLVVPADPYRLLAGELAVDGISSILGARALSTYTNGNDSATEILITGVDPQGSAVTFNLIVHISNGAITDFR